MKNNLNEEIKLALMGLSILHKFYVGCEPQQDRGSVLLLSPSKQKLNIGKLCVWSVPTLK